jgi:hypothetical protein
MKNQVQNIISYTCNFFGKKFFGVSSIQNIVVSLIGFISGRIVCAINTFQDKSGNILHTVNTARHPTLQHCNSYNRTDNHRQWNAVGSPDDGHKDARNMLR